jgi:hypothetical protein
MPPVPRSRRQTPVAPRADEARAKSLRPFERARRALRDDTHRALLAFEEAARDYERVRAAGEPADPRRVQRAAVTLTAALRAEVEQGTGALPSELANDVAKWAEGEFAGTDVDVEIANHALSSLLASDVLAELPVNDA